MKLAPLVFSLLLALPACETPRVETVTAAELDYSPAIWPRESRTMLRVDEASQTLEWLSIDRGVQLEDAAGIAHLRALLAGARIYPIEDSGLAAFNFDQLGELDSTVSWMRELAPDISIVGVGLAEDLDGSLILWRHTRVERAGYWLELAQLNAPSREVLEVGRFPALDAASLELQRAAYSAGAVDWRIEGRALVFDVPSTLDNALRCQEVILKQGTRSGPSLPLEASYFSYQDGRFTVRYLPRDNGWIRGETDADESMFDSQSTSAADLRKAGLPIETHAQLSARLAQLGLAD
jgi:hypothetical protein